MIGRDAFGLTYLSDKIDVDPTLNGYPLPIGSFAVYLGKLYFKYGSGDQNWTQVATSPATALLPGRLEAADFAKLATVPTGVPLNICGWLGPVVDLTATGNTVIVPASTFGGNWKLARSPGASGIALEKDGTVTTGPTVSIGNDGPKTNISASQTLATVASQASGTYVSISLVNPAPSPVALTSDVIINISSAAVLGTATYCRGRIFFQNVLFGEYA